jgi:GNAT superfamily N-acetyltransferase
MTEPDSRCFVLTGEHLDAAREVAANFVGAQGPETLAARHAAYPGFAIGLSVDGTLVGLAFGYPNSHGGVTLEAIAVDHAYSGRGLGSALLARFERAVAEAGYDNVDLGSAPGYVEHFYLKNGYEQTEYMVVIPDGDRRNLDLDGLEVLRERHWEHDDLVLNIAAPEGYSPAVKAALAARLQDPVISCIFRKPIAPIASKTQTAPEASTAPKTSTSPEPPATRGG